MDISSWSTNLSSLPTLYSVRLELAAICRQCSIAACGTVFAQHNVNDKLIKRPTYTDAVHTAHLQVRHTDVVRSAVLLNVDGASGGGVGGGARAAGQHGGQGGAAGGQAGRHPGLQRRQLVPQVGLQ